MIKTDRNKRIAHFPSIPRMTVNALGRAGIVTVQDVYIIVSNYGWEGLSGIRQVGKKSIQYIREALEKNGIQVPDPTRCITCGQVLPGAAAAAKGDICIWYEQREEGSAYNKYFSGCHLATWSGIRDELKKSKTCWGCGRRIILRVNTPAGAGYIDMGLE